MTEKVRWRVTQGGTTVACLCFEGEFDSRRAVRRLLAEAATPTGLVEGLVTLRYVDADGSHEVGDRAFLVCAAGAGGFARCMEVAFPAGPEGTAVRIRRDADAPGEAGPVEAGIDGETWYEAFWSTHGDYAFVDLRGPDGGETVAGAPGDPRHPMTMEQAERLAESMNSGLRAAA